MYNFYVTPEERKCLRELAKKQLEYSQLPIMEERKQLWYKHNEGNSVRPMIHVKYGHSSMTFFGFKCRLRPVVQLN